LSRDNSSKTHTQTRNSERTNGKITSIMKFSHSFKVSAADIDEQNHVNNVAYVRWIQDAAVAHWFSAANEIQRENLIWIVTRHEVDYKKPAFENEQITVTTWVGEPKRVSWERFTEIKRGADLLVKARSVWCLIDRATSKPTRIKSDLIKLF
jgi:acyl-CoA thioester hydrolase